MARAYTIRTLGACEVIDENGHSCDAIISQPRRLALLLFLSSSLSDYQSRDAVASFFWPNARRAHARGGLKQAVFAIRRLLGTDIVVSRGASELGINWARLGCDAREFMMAIDESRLTDAVGIYRGEFLGNFPLDAGSNFDKWRDAQRRDLAERFQIAISNAEKLRAPAGGNAALATNSTATSPENLNPVRAAGGDLRPRRKFPPAETFPSRGYVASVVLLLASAVAVAAIAGAAHRHGRD